MLSRNDVSSAVFSANSNLFRAFNFSRNSRIYVATNAVQVYKYSIALESIVPGSISASDNMLSSL